MDSQDLIRSSISVLKPQYARGDIEVVVASEVTKPVGTKMYFACVFVKRTNPTDARASSSLLEKGPHSQAPDKALDLLVTKLTAEVGALVTQQVPKMSLQRWRAGVRFLPTTDNTLELPTTAQPPPYQSG